MVLREEWEAWRKLSVASSKYSLDYGGIKGIKYF